MERIDTMTVKDYIEKNKALPDELQAVLLEQTNIWTNEACRGYVIKVLERMEKSKEEIEKVISNLNASFDEISIEEAEQAWRNF